MATVVPGPAPARTIRARSALSTRSAGPHTAGPLAAIMFLFCSQKNARAHRRLHTAFQLAVTFIRFSYTYYVKSVAVPAYVWAPDRSLGGPGPAAGASFPGSGRQVHCALCSIIPVGGNWIVRCGTVDHGPFMSKGIALRRAFAEAQAVRAKGQRSRVSVQDGSGRVANEHCLCADYLAVRGRVGRNSIIRFSL